MEKIRRYSKVRVLFSTNHDPRPRLLYIQGPSSDPPCLYLSRHCYPTDRFDIILCSMEQLPLAPERKLPKRKRYLRKRPVRALMILPPRAIRLPVRRQVRMEVLQACRYRGPPRVMALTTIKTLMQLSKPKWLRLFCTAK